MTSPLPDPATAAVLGVRFHSFTRLQAATEIARLARSGRRSYVVKPYSEFLPRAASDDGIRSILNGAALCLPDGMGIVWAAYYLSLPGGRVRALLQLPLSLGGMALRPSSIRQPLREAMAGVDLTWQMLAELERGGASVFLLGGTQREVSAACRVIARRLPGLKLAGSHHGHFTRTGAGNEAVIATINEAAPDVLLVAMGFPRQERWIAANLELLSVRLTVAEGGSFSFISGSTRRAPQWMRRAGLEWLFRLLRQPSRLRRQLALPVFVWLVARERLRRAG